MAVIYLKNEASPAALESRNDEQAATDRNQVLEQSNVEIWLAQGPYEPSAGVKAGDSLRLSVLGVSALKIFAPSNTFLTQRR